MKKNNEGILLIDKEASSTSFHLVSILRRFTQIQKIGHAGTLDPFATGVMVMLVGPTYTKLSETFLNHDKQYKATIHLGITTDTYDIDGQVTQKSPHIPAQRDIEAILPAFQGEILQTPPMFSAKKVQGKKLYELARQGITIERKPSPVKISIQLLSYEYPFLKLLIDCSKGTYIRSLAFDLGENLGTGAHLAALTRTRSGPFLLDKCVPQTELTPTLIEQSLFQYEA